MENITSPGFEKMEEAESNDFRSLSPLLPTDDEFSDNEAFLLNEESNLVEGDFMTSGMGNIFEDDALSLPSEDSLYHLDEYFTLRTFNHPKKHH